MMPHKTLSDLAEEHARDLARMSMPGGVPLHKMTSRMRKKALAHHYATMEKRVDRTGRRRKAKDGLDLPSLPFEPTVKE
jgi:hypothetical protein